ncbi:iron uptake porin [Microcoleus vaginatus GB1-A2]|uniref:iron uptake porin n=1 Tax=Microcoleus vaginatus TaxID=119532 RepID=UPI0032A9F0E8
MGDDKTTGNLGYRVRLNFETSFTGTDRVRTRLQARNNARYDRTPMTRTNFDGDGGSQITLDKLSYQFVIGSHTNVEIRAKKLTSDDVAPLINPYFDSAAQGAVSRFGAFNPDIYNTPGETGIAINHQLIDHLN